jgi:hypothetical protein
MAMSWEGRVGDISGAGGAGESAVGEADRVPDSTGGVSRIKATERVEEATGDNGRRDGGVMDGGVIGVGVAGTSGVARQERGERRYLPSSSGPRSNSTSFRCLLTRLAGGIQLLAAREMVVV